MRDGGRRLPARLATAGAALALVFNACSGTAAGPNAGSSAPGSSHPASISDLPIEAAFDQTVPCFAYDSSVPLDMKDAIPPVSRDGVTVREITYQATSEMRVPAFLVSPSGGGPFPAVIFLHAEGAGGLSKDEFLDEAIDLAMRGVVSLLPSRLFPGMTTPVDWRTDRQSVVDQVVQLRRGIDLLLSQPGVDAERIGYVGHDYGGMNGAILAAVDDRVKTAVFMSFNATWAEWFFLNYYFDDSARTEYPKGMAAMDPIAAIAHLPHTSIFLQYGGQDGFNSSEMRAKVEAAAQGEKTTVYPDAGWNIDVPAARTDRTAWLITELRIDS
jgi:dienelactone hydrolase